MEGQHFFKVNCQNVNLIGLWLVIATHNSGLNHHL